MIDRIICFIILVWIGLYNQGMCYYHSSMNKIMLYNKKMINGDWKGEEIRCMLETSKGEILMGTTQGVYRYEPSTRRMNRFYHEFSQKNCRVLYEDSKERIWVGTYHDGLYLLGLGTLMFAR